MKEVTPVLFLAPKDSRRESLWGPRAQQAAQRLGFDVRLAETMPEPGAHAVWKELLRDEVALITTWGSPTLDAHLLPDNDTLKIVGHAAGSVANIVSDALYDRGVRVVTANSVMARSVAEWSLMMTFMAAWRAPSYISIGGAGSLDRRRGETARSPRELSIGIWGFGDVARNLVRMLGPLQPGRMLVCDAYASEEDARDGGFERVDLQTLFAEADVLHMLTGLTPETCGRVDEALLSRIQGGATLINCGRAKLIQREAFLAALQQQRFHAILDVHYQEPVAADDPFRLLPNVTMTPHCAGLPGREFYVPAVLEDFARFFRGEPLQSEITRERAASMTDGKLVASL